MTTSLRNIPAPAIAHHSVPLYALPVFGVSYGELQLVVQYNDSDLPNPGNVSVTQPPIDFGTERLFNFTIENRENQNCTFTEFTVTGDIKTKSRDVVLGTGITGGESRFFIMKNFLVEEPPDGINTFTGQIIIKGTFDNGQKAQNIVNITYRLYKPPKASGSLKSGDGPGRLHPNVYIDEYRQDLNRSSSSSGNNTSPNFSGTTPKQ